MVFKCTAINIDKKISFKEKYNSPEQTDDWDHNQRDEDDDNKYTADEDDNCWTYCKFGFYRVHLFFGYIKAKPELWIKICVVSYRYLRRIRIANI